MFLLPDYLTLFKFTGNFFLLAYLHFYYLALIFKIFALPSMVIFSPGSTA